MPDWCCSTTRNSIYILSSPLHHVAQHFQILADICILVELLPASLSLIGAGHGLASFPGHIGIGCVSEAGAGWPTFSLCDFKKHHQMYTLALNWQITDHLTANQTAGDSIDWTDRFSIVETPLHLIRVTQNQRRWGTVDLCTLSSLNI